MTTTTLDRRSSEQYLGKKEMDELLTTIQKIQPDHTLSITLDTYGHHTDPSHIRTVYFRLSDAVGAERAVQVATFKLALMTGCCGIDIFTGLYVENTYRRHGIGTILTKMAMNMSKYNGYTLMTASDIAGSLESKTLEKLGWKEVQKFTNNRTHNTISVYNYNLNDLG